MLNFEELYNIAKYIEGRINDHASINIEDNKLRIEVFIYLSNLKYTKEKVNYFLDFFTAKYRSNLCKILVYEESRNQDYLIVTIAGQTKLDILMNFLEFLDSPEILQDTDKQEIILSVFQEKNKEEIDNIIMKYGLVGLLPKTDTNDITKFIISLFQAQRPYNINDNKEEKSKENIKWKNKTFQEKLAIDEHTEQNIPYRDNRSSIAAKAKNKPTDIIKYNIIKPMFCKIKQELLDKNSEYKVSDIFNKIINRTKKLDYQLIKKGESNSYNSHINKEDKEFAKKYNIEDENDLTYLKNYFAKQKGDYSYKTIRDWCYQIDNNEW